MATTSPPRLFLTVDVEEWFASKELVRVGDDSGLRAASDIAETTSHILDSFARAGFVGTFFLLLDIARRHPELVERMTREGHEVALHGETHEHLSRVGDADFAAMLGRSRGFFQDRFGVRLQGYRAPYFSIDEPKLARLKTAGFSYDSSVFPCLPIPGWYGSWRAPLTPYRIGRRLHEIEPQGAFMEFPLSVHPALRLPGLGGYYFRNLGLGWSLRVMKGCLTRLGYAMFYLHPWELSDRLPADAGLPFYMRRRAGAWARESLDRLLAAARAVPGLKNSTVFEHCRQMSAGKA
ncbi:MAG: DUF3473 domain-containing protein [Elusimicrobia bacterium]|nr:DUF3473 domain-containing protein [Elusimicrobiota bacterium]